MVRVDSPLSASLKTNACIHTSSISYIAPKAGRMCFSALLVYVASVDSLTICLFISRHA